MLRCFDLLRAVAHHADRMCNYWQAGLESVSCQRSSRLLVQDVRDG